MSDFNFKSQICTDKNQSERLLALGLKKETADMALILNESDKTYFARPRDYVCAEASTSIPAWSLHRMMSMLTAKRKCMLIRFEADLYDVLINRIEQSIKGGSFNKEYLV